MSRLVKKVTGKNRTGKMADTFLRPETGQSPPDVWGITADGVHSPLDGQPPPAQSNGWGERPGG